VLSRKSAFGGGLDVGLGRLAIDILATEKTDKGTVCPTYSGEERKAAWVSPKGNPRSAFIRGGTKRKAIKKGFLGYEKKS